MREKRSASTVAARFETGELVGIRNLRLKSKFELAIIVEVLVLTCRVFDGNRVRPITELMLVKLP